MTKNPKIRRRTPRQPHMNREIVEMEAYLASERLQNEASYCSRGRRFKPLTDAALKQRWIKCLRRTINADRFRALRSRSGQRRERLRLLRPPAIVDGRASTE